MSRRARTLRYGAAIGVTLVGVACGALIPGSAGGTAATVLVGIGLVGAVSLIFYEVGLTEDRERARESARGQEKASVPAPSDHGTPREHGTTGDHETPGEHAVPGEHQGGRLRPLERRRGQRRRLR